ncbi:hypothetical protein [Methylobacterium oxalidis]|uniref:Uncharacterized protein n=1 Tax=Methylobacterium oxalidis TaxID=944322 RepID=A0A512J859_9HYPH|nr:hypothetical protein [Methylobacterium oxalidis]GEP06130.1 hypothetical protein MOX02_41680 [Methylobacterium oxalidis]GJE34606.1 hypothetical protein LDDCCGHA_4818 [Methylobacterium oxalidis]GLS65149.1 hypothetical protein GCM10007888_35310 [Methylobacterium oxalidis]
MNGTWFTMPMARRFASMLLTCGLLGSPSLALAELLPGREIREAPEWKGKLDPPSPTCPPNFTNPSNEPYIFSCKAGILGKVENGTGFTPGLWEDKSDPDWAYLKQYWRTDRLIYFAATQCEGGKTQHSDTAAQMAARQWAQKRVDRWNAELKRSKFRPALEFREIKTVYECVPGILTNTTPGYSEAEDAEGEASGIRAAEAAERAEQERKGNSVTFKIASNDVKSIRLKFFSQQRNHVWPGSNQSYTIGASDSDYKTYNLSCRKGEKICFGAFRDDDENVAWGSGRYDKMGCQDCCTTCGGSGLTTTLNAGPTGPPRNKIVFKMTSRSPYRVHLQFTSKNRNHVWPASGRVYTLADSDEHRYELDCAQGEKICYGAYVEGNSSSYWGVGHSLGEGCTNCCSYCGKGTFSATLTGGSGSGGGGGVGSVVDAIGTGAAIGSAIGNILNRSGGGRVYTPRSPPMFNRNPSNSGISR